MPRSEPLADIVTGEQSVCVNCRADIFAVIDPYSGVVDWGSGPSEPEDFGCDRSPDTSGDGVGGHHPGDGHTPLGFRTRSDRED